MSEQAPEGRLDARRIMYWAVILAVCIALLATGRTFLIPLAVAVLLWSLLDALREVFQRLGPAGHTVPPWLATLLAVSLMLLGVYLIYVILAGQANALQQAAPVYQANFARLTDKAMDVLGMEELPAVAQLVDRINVGRAFTWLTRASESIGNVTIEISQRSIRRSRRTTCTLRPASLRTGATMSPVRSAWEQPVIP